MNILIYEYFLGQDKNINLSPEVLHEAKLIINSLIIDITGLHDKPKISLFISKKIDIYLIVMILILLIRRHKIYII